MLLPFAAVKHLSLLIGKQFRCGVNSHSDQLAPRVLPAARRTRTAKVAVSTTGSPDLPLQSLAGATAAAGGIHVSGILVSNQNLTGLRVEAGALRKMFPERQLLELKGILLLLQVVWDQRFLRLIKMRRVVVTLPQALTKLQILITASSFLKQVHWWQGKEHQVHLQQLKLCQQHHTNL